MWSVSGSDPRFADFVLRVRQYWLPQRVSLHADPSEMSAAYLSAAVQKAATLRKHDAGLWWGAAVLRRKKNAPINA